MPLFITISTIIPPNKKCVQPKHRLYARKTLCSDYCCDTISIHALRKTSMTTEHAFLPN